MAAVKPIPEGQHSITPHLVIRECGKAIEFYKKAFGAVEKGVMKGPGGGVMHAEMTIGDSFIYLADEFPGVTRSPQSIGGTAVTIHLYAADCDKTFNQAVAAGAKATVPPVDMFWGDRYAKVTDPFGHEWSIATHKEDVSPAECERRGIEAMAAMGKK